MISKGRAALCTCGLASALSLVSLQAQASEPAPPSTPRTESYRAPLALWYGVALSTSWVPYLLMRGCTGYDCLGIYFVILNRFGTAWAPPIVHWTRGRVGRGFVSLGGQLLAAVVGGTVGSALLEPGTCKEPRNLEDSDDCPLASRAGFDGFLIADFLWAATDVLLTPPSIPRESSGLGSLRITSSPRGPSDGIELQLGGSF